MKKESIQTRKRKPKNPGAAREGPPKKLSSSYSYLKQQQAKAEAERMQKEQEEAAVQDGVLFKAELKPEQTFAGKIEKKFYWVMFKI